MKKDGKNLNAGDPHLDGDGEYTPPVGGQLENTGNVPQQASEGQDEAITSGQEEGPDLARVRGDDFEITGNEPVDESDVEFPMDGVEYAAPKPPGDEDGEKSPMDELADGTAEEVGAPAVSSLEEAVAEPVEVDVPVEKTTGVKTESPPSGTPVEKVAPTTKSGINMENVVIEQKLTQSTKPGFDPTETQDARRDITQEGGIARNRTTGNQFQSNGKPEGFQLRPGKSAGKPDYTEMYEMAGFTVSFEKTKGQGNVNVEIRDYFVDLATAQASVNGDKYLMPMPQIGFKVVEIVYGAPTISYQDRMLYEYISDKWRRK